MTAPVITPLPDAPSRQDDPSTFVTKSDAFVAALPTFADETNAAAAYVDGVGGAVDAALTDPGFVAVAADLVGDNDIGTVAANIADVTTCAVNMDDIQAAPAAAADALTAAASVYVTSSAHPLASGNRTATAIANGGSFTTTLTTGGGTIANLINGSVTNDNTNAIVLTGIALTGHELFRWIFPLGRSLICDSVTIKNSGTQSYGAGTFYALKNDGTWVAVSTSANIGGATSVTIALTAIDKGGYLGLRCVFDSGTAGSGRMLEIEFKFANAAQDALYKLPATTGRGKMVQHQSAIPGDYVLAEPRGFFRTVPAGHSPLCEYLFDGKGTDTVVTDYSGNGKHIDLAAAVTAYGGGYQWVKEGLRLDAGLCPTPSITSWRTIVAVWEVDYEATGYQLATSSTSGQAFVNGSTFNGNCTIHTGHGGESVAPLYADVSGAAGSSAFKLDRGGAVMVFIDRITGQTSQICLGGPITATTTNRTVQMKCSYLAAYSTGFNDAERTYMRDGLRPALEPRGIYFDWRDCRTYHIGALHVGQSNVGNASIPVTSVSAPTDALSTTNLASAAYTPSTWILSAGRQNESWMSQPQEYRAGFNSVPGRANGLGFEAGMAIAHEEAYQTRKRRLAICKIAPGSASVYQSANNNSWNVANTVGVGLMGYALKRFWSMEQYFLKRGEGVRLVAINTQDGEQECGATGTSDGAPAVYQTRKQEIWDKFKEQLKFSGLKMQIGQLAPYQVGSPLTQASIDTVRAAQVALVAANSTEMTLVSTASGLLQGDFLHFTADNEVTRGRTFYAGMPTS